MIASEAFRALGTTAALFVTEAGALERGRPIVDDELEAIDRACSRFRPDSELSRLNEAGGRPIRGSDLFLTAVEVALDAARVTDGAVDPTVGRALRAIGYDRDFEEVSARPLRSVRAARVDGWRAVRVDRRAGTVQVAPGVELDLGATAKALAADRTARRVQEAIGGGVLVNLGGDVSIAGPAPPGGWLIQVTDDHAHPRPGAGQTVSIAAGGLATSSTTVRRWSTAERLRHHIVDPRSGDSAAEVWRTVSVTASTCVDANVASTAAIVHGQTAPQWLDELRLPSRLVGATGEVVCVGGWPEEGCLS